MFLKHKKFVNIRLIIILCVFNNLFLIRSFYHCMPFLYYFLKKKERERSTTTTTPAIYFKSDIIIIINILKKQR